MRRHAPNGIDVLWDNVGGDQLNVLLAQNLALCQGGDLRRHRPVRDHGNAGRPAELLQSRGSNARPCTTSGAGLRVRISDGEGAHRRVIREGKIRTRLDMQQGLENAPKTLIGLFKGQNIGKQLMKVA